eukprot:gene13057-biopygen7987
MFSSDLIVTERRGVHFGWRGAARSVFWMARSSAECILGGTERRGVHFGRHGAALSSMGCILGAAYRVSGRRGPVQGEQDSGAGVARAWRGRGAGYRHFFLAWVARTWRGHGGH